MGQYQQQANLQHAILSKYGYAMNDSGRAFHRGRLAMFEALAEKEQTEEIINCVLERISDGNSKAAEAFAEALHHALKNIGFS